MTTVEFSRSIASAEPHHAHGWAVSLLCHMLGVGGALLLMAEIEKPVLPKPFHWDVAMVETPAPAEPAPVKPPPPTPSEKRAVERMMEPRPVVTAVEPLEPVVRDVETPLETRVESRPSVETVEPVEQTVRDVVAAAESVTAEPVTERPVFQTHESSAVVTQTAAMSREPALEHVVAQPTVSSVLERAQPQPVEDRAVVHSTPEPRRTETAERESPRAESIAPAIEDRSVRQRVVRFRRTQADYGWLRDALWSRIEQLKRYPAQAKTNHWEGKVVMEAVIRDDGQVVGLKVAESSGHALLDQEAMAVMRKASPLTLKHPLGKSHVTILVPISYRLDG